MLGDAKVSRQVEVLNSLGLHARPAAVFAREASAFTADITVSKNGHVSDGKSTIGLLMLAAEKGTTLDITATGPDAEEAIEVLEKLFRDKFGEE